MNVIDLVVCLVMLVAVVNGWRQGFIVQVCSLAGIVAGIWLAARYGAAVGAWLKMDESFAAPGGFVTVLVVVVLAVAVAARVVRKLFHFAGFGLPDHILGIAVAAVKNLLLLSVLFSLLGRFNRECDLVKPETIEKSICFEPVLHLSEHIFPFLDWVGDQMPQREEEPKKE